MDEMDELDFTIEFNSDLNDKVFERDLLAQAETRLQRIRGNHHDITGAMVTIRKPAKKETAPIHEATVVVYARPERIVGKEKNDTPSGALKGALDAVERQIRKKREKLGKPWEQPQNDPVTKEVIELMAAEEVEPDVEALVEELEELEEEDLKRKGKGKS